MRATRIRRRRGLTLMEVMVTLAVISVLAASSVTTVVRTVEQVHVDYAGAALRTVWNAQRLYWVENRTYASSITQLETAGLLDSSLTSPRFSFSIAASSSNTFLAEAARTTSARWSGTLSVNETGAVSGTITGGGDVLSPGF